MKFSLVTTCLNEGDSFPLWKADILAQTRQPDEIVIVDAFSTDGTANALFDWAQQDSRVRIVQQKSNAAKGRNIAVAESHGDVVVSTDMGCRVDRRWFELLCVHFEVDPTVDVVMGAYDVERDNLRGAVAWADFYISGGHRGIPQPGFLPSNRSVAYKIRAWEQLGGLPEDLTLCADDLVLGMQLLDSSLRVAYSKDAMVHWERPSKFSAFWREQYRYGVGKGEADVMRPVAGHRYASGSGAWRIYDQAFRSAIHSWRHCVRALLEGHLLAACAIPPLTFGNSVNLDYGFAAGFRTGRIHCQKSRDRVASYRIAD